MKFSQKDLKLVKHHNITKKVGGDIKLKGNNGDIDLKDKDLEYWEYVFELPECIISKEGKNLGKEISIMYCNLLGLKNIRRHFSPKTAKERAYKEYSKVFNKINGHKRHKN